MLNEYDIIGYSKYKKYQEGIKDITWKLYQKVAIDEVFQKMMKAYNGFEYFTEIWAYDWTSNWMPVCDLQKSSATNFVYKFNEPFRKFDEEIKNFNCSFSSNSNGYCSNFNFELVYKISPDFSIEQLFNKICKFIIGVRMIGNDYIYWFSLGCGVINQPSFKIDKQTYTYSFSATDLMCLLDGTRAGSPALNRIGGSYWKFNTDELVKENLINLLKTFTKDCKFNGKGINILPEEIDLGYYFEDCRDMRITEDKKYITDSLVVINKNIELNESGTILSTIQEIIKYSNPNYIFKFDNHGVPTYYRDPLYTYDNLPDTEKNCYDIPHNYIISYDLKEDFSNIVNAVSVYGFTRDLTAIKDNLFSGELICDGQPHVHPTTKQTITTHTEYIEELDCYVWYTFCDLLPCELEQFEYTGDMSWGCNTIIIDEAWFNKGKNKPIVIYVNNVPLSALHPSSVEKSIYMNTTNILVWNRIDVEPQVYEEETSYWQWESFGKLAYKATRVAKDIFMGDENFKYLQSPDYSGYLDKNIKDETCDSNEKVIYTALKELFDSFYNKYTLTISVPMTPWITPSTWITYNPNDYLTNSEDDWDWSNENEFSLARYVKLKRNTFWQVDNINFNNGVTTITAKYLFKNYLKYMLLILENKQEIDYDENEIKIFDDAGGEENWKKLMYYTIP